MSVGNPNFVKGCPGGPGRPKGSKDKFNAFRNRIIDTFEKLDAITTTGKAVGDWLLQFALDHPRDFVKIAASVLPKDLNINDARKFSPEDMAEALEKLRKMDFKPAGGILEIFKGRMEGEN